jgi:hypothetical protein
MLPYLAAPIVLALASIVAVYLALTMLNALIQEAPDWLGLTLNLAPGFATGFVIVHGLTARLLRRYGRSAVPAHWVRMLPLYVGIVLLLVVIASSSTQFDFRFVGQLFIVPCTAFVGGVVGDGVASTRVGDA